MALAEPAASEPPMSVATMSPSGGMPRWARIMAGTVVTSSSSMMRGLVRAMYARTLSIALGAGSGARWSEPPASPSVESSPSGSGSPASTPVTPAAARSAAILAVQ